MLLIGRVIVPYFVSDDPYFPLLFTGFEVGILGIPLFGAIYGLEKVRYIALLDKDSSLHRLLLLFFLAYW